eukprot:TRINITY_DN3366_c0_g2_i1.p1 TRINITY_DN3366_c0_g2~~TRINITY_DN3366_c0_g2_i1.p1  ORF type:complete len:598 (+),score=110.38 TRINITY_DN3366_c0_g2_i1:111-1904(+)
MSKKGAGAPVQESPTAARSMPRIISFILNQENRTNFARRVLASSHFDFGIGMVICLNAGSVGLEQTLSLEKIDTTSVKVAENLFLVIYIIELGLRLFAFGRAAFQDNWVKFDFFLVVLGALTSWIIEPFLTAGNELAPLMVLRTLRLLRLAKMARFLIRFREFWMLVRGILSSAGIVMYTMVILFVILYVFSSIGIELITKHRLNIGPDPDEEFQDHVNTYFSSLPNTMFTLVQFASLDGSSGVYRLFVEKDPRLAFYFLTVVFLVGIIFMNLITAVIVTRSIEQSMVDKDVMQHQVERRCEVLVGELKETLLQGDIHDTGFVSRSEIHKMSGKIAKADQEMLCESLRVRSLMEIFETLDVDNSAKIPINELCDGIWKDIKSKEPLEVKRMQKQVDAMHFRLKDDVTLEREIQTALLLACDNLSALKLSTEQLYQRIEKVTSDVISKQQGLPCAKASAEKKSQPMSDITSLIRVKPTWASELTTEFREITKELTTDFEAMLKGDQTTCTSISSEGVAPYAPAVGYQGPKLRLGTPRHREGESMKCPISPGGNEEVDSAYIHKTSSTSALPGFFIPRGPSSAMPSPNEDETSANCNAV